MISAEYTVTDLNKRIYDFAFDYLKKKYVKVSSKNITTGVVTNCTYGVHYVIVDKTVELLQSVGAVGDVLRIVRETPTSEQIVSWNDASILKASDMSLSQLQQLHILEEYGEHIDMNCLALTIGGQYDANHSRIINLLDPQTATDAVNKGYVDSMVGSLTSAQNSTTVAQDSATSAQNSATVAQASALSAQNDALSAKSWAVDNISSRPEGSAKYWSEQSRIYAELAGSGGTTDHNILTNKNLPNQHTIDAITGLLDELGKRPLTTDVNVMINSITDGAPVAYNTLKKVADYIAQDQSDVASILSSLGNKVDKEAGKGLSSNDYTDTDKSKVHTHTNQNVLDKIGESLGGLLTYNGMEVSSGSGGSGGSGGTGDHNLLTNRSADNQHTINAIQGLQTELDKKVSVTIGKGLSSNDYDNTAKSKVDNLSITKVIDLDAVESASHTHTNTSVLSKVGEDANGNITFNGNHVNDKLANARTIEITGKITGTATSFDGSSNIAIPVTSVVADSCTGNSATATKLKTPVSINGIPFDGSTNIDIPTSGGGGGSSKYIYTVNNTFTVTKAGTYNITAVAGGGGGTSCMGCGGGSGTSVSGYAVTLGVGDTISFTIGMGGSGSKVVGENVALPSSGAPYAGANGGNTVITISKSALPPQNITLTGGGGASCPTPSSIKYQAGLGENNGGIMAISMFNNSTQQTAWTGGNGGSSIFGNGGSGGVITYDNFQKIPAKNAIAYGAGGGGGGFRQVGTSGTYYWTAGGDGMQGCVIIEVA